MYYMETDFNSIKDRMLDCAAESFNAALVKAIRFSRGMADLRRCVKQVHGVGAARFRDRFSYLIPKS